jgi:hypothetical protein
MTTLADILRGVERGVFPAPDLGITVVPAPSPREACVVAFTGHIVIAANVDPAWVAERVPQGDLSAPTNPPSSPHSRKSPAVASTRSTRCCSRPP